MFIHIPTSYTVLRTIVKEDDPRHLAASYFTSHPEARYMRTVDRQHNIIIWRKFRNTHMVEGTTVFSPKHNKLVWRRHCWNGIYAYAVPISWYL